MAGIQVHTSSPINPNTPTKSKETTAEPTRTLDTPAYAPATTTAATAPTSAQAAQPGAAAVPAPSAAASAYTPPSPTRTTAMPPISKPPPPQPGQVPQPFGDQAKTISPPPPQVGAVPQTSQQFASPTQTRAPQSNFPPPTPPSAVQWTSSYAYAQPPAGMTSTAQDLSHPPGYVQHRGSFDDRYVEPENSTHNPNPTYGRGGLLDAETRMRNASDEDANPIWDTAMSWAKEAGRKLSVVEGEVWKKINGDK